MGHLESVDNALRVLTLLGEGERYSVSQVAGHLGVAPSTAHRILSTLVYRDFASQADDRSYGAGPALHGLGEHRHAPNLTEVAQPHLRRAMRAVGETCHLAVLTERDVRFLVSVECDRALRIGSRVGHVLPAHRTAAGKVLLADQPLEELHRNYPREGAPDLGISAERGEALYREFAGVRQRGYAVNRGASERGLHAFAVAVPGRDGRASAAITCTLPSVRSTNARIPELVAAVEQAAAGMSLALA